MFRTCLQLEQVSINNDVPQPVPVLYGRRKESKEKKDRITQHYLPRKVDLEGCMLKI